MEQKNSKKNFFEQAKEFGGMMANLGNSFDLQTLLTDSFLQTYTQYRNLTELKNACGGKIQTIDDFENLEDTSFLSQTNFQSVEEMFHKAMEVHLDSVFNAN